jgi:hypothetical protein
MGLPSGCNPTGDSWKVKKRSGFGIFFGTNRMSLERLRKAPLPSPPPEYRERGKDR